MFLAAARALSGMVTAKQRQDGHLLPEMEDIRKVSRGVAKAVAVEAREAGLGRLLEDDEIGRVVAKAQWEPHDTAQRPGRVSERE